MHGWCTATRVVVAASATCQYGTAAALVRVGCCQLLAPVGTAQLVDHGLWGCQVCAHLTVPVCSASGSGLVGAFEPPFRTFSIKETHSKSTEDSMQIQNSVRIPSEIR